jgi:thymidylate synthase (FAD)
MNKIEVAIIGDYGNPGDMAGFLARLTQRGHKIKTMQDLMELYDKGASSQFVEAIAGLPHGTIKRFTPITIAIVGASRRFLAQARTNQVGFNYVSASLQYSDYSSDAQFVVPYSVMAKDHDFKIQWGGVRSPFTEEYLKSCNNSMKTYEYLATHLDNDTAGYAAPQGLRNILIMQGNHQSWDYFIRTRACNRNTVETQYVATLIWDVLLGTDFGQEFFGKAGAACTYGACPEGKFCCGDPMRKYVHMAEEQGISVPRAIINDKWPLLNKEVTA